MIKVSNNQEFRSNTKATTRDASGVRVTLGSGSAKLQIETPDGWVDEKIFTTSGSSVFQYGRGGHNFRFVLTGNATAYLL